MASPENILGAIDSSVEAQHAAEARAEELVENIGKLIKAVAATEATYEIESASELSKPASLEETVEAITVSRVSLVDSIEQAIFQYRQSYKERHSQTLLREKIVGDIT